MRVQHEGGAAAWLTGTLVVPQVGGTWSASTAGVRALSQSFMEPHVAGNRRASLASLSP